MQTNAFVWILFSLRCRHCGSAQMRFISYICMREAARRRRVLRENCLLVRGCSSSVGVFGWLGAENYVLSVCAHLLWQIEVNLPLFLYILYTFTRAAQLISQPRRGTMLIEFMCVFFSRALYILLYDGCVIYVLLYILRRKDYLYTIGTLCNCVWCASILKISSKYRYWNNMQQHYGGDILM